MSTQQPNRFSQARQQAHTLLATQPGWPRTLDAANRHAATKIAERMVATALLALHLVPITTTEPDAKRRAAGDALPGRQARVIECQGAHASSMPSVQGVRRRCRARRATSHR